MLSMPFICFLHLQRRRPLFRKYVGISSRPSERSSATSYQERLGVCWSSNMVCFACQTSNKLSLTHHHPVCLFFGSNTTSSGRQRIATHKCRHKEADSLNMLRVMQSGTLEGSKKLESGLYLVSKWVPNATNLNSWAIYPVLRETWFSSVKLQKNFLNCSHVINALLTPFKKNKNM